VGNVAIIPARGGSKRIPRKNIKLFHGKPVIGYAIELAISSELFDEVYVSTDDIEIREISLSYGARVPWLRDETLSNDHTSTIDVMSDAVTKIMLEN
jgi:pseudaminic acid cytidylyltransferase